MNLQSILLLAVILLVSAIVLVRYVKRQRRTGGCGSCQCGCDGCDRKSENCNQKLC